MENNKTDVYEYNNCPIRISFFVEFNRPGVTINTQKSSTKKYHLRFETIKNSIAEPIKDFLEKDSLDDIKKINIEDNKQHSQRMVCEDENTLIYFIMNLELDFSVPKLFRILFLSSEGENLESSYTCSLVDLFLHAYEKDNFKPNNILFTDLFTGVVSIKGTGVIPLKQMTDRISITFKKKIKYPKYPKAEDSIYVTQKISKFVKTTTSYDVTVRRHDFNFFKSLFYRPHTQLAVSCGDINQPIYLSPIFVNALYFKIDTFNILTSKYIDKKGIPLNQIFSLRDWSGRKEKIIYSESVQKNENKNLPEETLNIDPEDNPSPNNKRKSEKEPLLKKDDIDKKEEKKCFSVEKRDISERTFVQLLCKEVRIQTIIAIDFSSSNRPVLIKNSLHSGDSHTNLYLGAMNCIYDTLSVFDEKNSVSLYGLSAKIKGVFHEFFPITKTKSNENDQESNLTIDNKYSSKEEIEGAYNYYRQMLQFWGPTKVSGFLKHAKELALNANKENCNVFTVLTIITDGLIVDLHDIVQSVFGMEKVPIFIVFVGIGEEKSDRGFLSLKQIDDNLNEMKQNGEDENIFNDIVKFAHFKTENLVEKSSFSKDLFQEIPDEVARFMNQRSNKEEL